MAPVTQFGVTGQGGGHGSPSQNVDIRNWNLMQRIGTFWSRQGCNLLLCSLARRDAARCSDIGQRGLWHTARSGQLVGGTIYCARTVSTGHVQSSNLGQMFDKI